MVKIGMNELRKHPSLLKNGEIIELVDKKNEKRIGVFIPQKYSAIIEKVLKNIEKKRRQEILRTIKDLDDMREWDEVVGDGL